MVKLGQNFLTSKKIVDEIVRAGEVGPDDVVLEVGPGKGILTEALAEKAGRVIAVEKDEELVEFLREKFAGQKNLEIVQGDILKFNPISHKIKAKGYKIIANIPYYITSHFLRKFLESDCQPSKMVLMAQKEVAERIARSKKQSILSISVRVFAEPKYIRTVPAGYFSPKPKVDSAILLIDKISKDFFRDIDEKKFFGMARAGFSSKRKLLKNNLPILATEWLTQCEIAEKARAENLSPENWKCLYKNL